MCSQLAAREWGSAEVSRAAVKAEPMRDSAGCGPQPQLASGTCVSKCAVFAFTIAQPVEVACISPPGLPWLPALSSWHSKLRGAGRQPSHRRAIFAF